MGRKNLITTALMKRERPNTLQPKLLLARTTLVHQETFPGMALHTGKTPLSQIYPRFGKWNILFPKNGIDVGNG
jgi:hypothetical protein